MLQAASMPHDGEVLDKDDRTFAASHRVPRFLSSLLRFEPVAADSEIDDERHRKLGSPLHFLLDE